MVKSSNPVSAQPGGGGRPNSNALVCLGYPPSHQIYGYSGCHSSLAYWWLRLWRQATVTVWLMAMFQRAWPCLWLRSQFQQVSSICQANLLSRCVGDLCKEFVDSYTYTREKVFSWIHQVQKLSTTAESLPQSAYAAFVQDLQNKWVFLCHTMPNMAQHLQPLDDAITSIFMPALLSRTISVTARLFTPGITKQVWEHGLTVPSTLANPNQSLTNISRSLE